MEEKSQKLSVSPANLTIFGTIYLRYHRLRWKMEAELARAAAVQKEMAATAAAASKEGDSEDLRDIGDVNPFVLGMSKEQVRGKGTELIR